MILLLIPPNTNNLNNHLVKIKKSLYNELVENTRLVSDVERLSESLGKLPEPAAEPAFVVVSGLPGTGKSYFCSRLAERLPVVVLESDALRKALFSIPDYSFRESYRLFQAIHRLVEKLLKKGISLVLDSTNLIERNREFLYNIASRLNARLILVWVEAPPQVVRQRLERRAQDSGNKSDADWEVYRKMVSTAQKIRRNHYVVDTSNDITPAIDKIIKEVTH